MAGPGSSPDQSDAGREAFGPSANQEARRRRRWLAVPRNLLLGATGAIGLAAVAAIVLVFFALMVGGGIYEVSCDTGTRLTQEWALEGDIPYTWSPGRGCTSHTLTRFVLGKIGIMRDVSP